VDPVERFFFHTTAALAGLCVAIAACSPDMSLFGAFVAPPEDDGGIGGAGAEASSSPAASSSSGVLAFWAQGVQQGVHSDALSGWSECWAEPFGNADTPVSQILEQCQGSLLALGCRPNGSAMFALLAMAQRSDAIFDTNPPTNPAVTHQANGVGWYFNEYGWGFAPAGDKVVLGNCDVVDIKGGEPGPDGDLRMCVKFHSSPEWATHPGFRCGKLWESVAPGFGATYERVVLSAD